MINLLNTTTGKPPNRALAFGLSIIILMVIAASMPAFAHGGFDHVRGTVVKVANNVLTVKTASGNVDVKLDNQTYLTRNDQKAQLADLKFGVRVVVDIPKDSKDRVAHSVKIGAVTKPVDQQAHGSRK
jgi:hypothetical protein